MEICAVYNTKQLTRRSADSLGMADIVLREFLQSFFKFSLKSSFFFVQTTGGTCNCLIIINKVLFDYRHKTPAIDLAYCFVDSFDKSSILSKWKSIVNSSNQRTLAVNKESLDILKEVFDYFARRTMEHYKVLKAALLLCSCRNQIWTLHLRKLSCMLSFVTQIRSSMAEKILCSI